MGDPRVGGALAIIADVGNAWRLTHVNGPARSAGVSVGQSLADARAICPDLLIEPADPEREDALLRTLWRWSDRWSDRVALDSPDGLLLDIAGCAHLFGGEEAIANEIRTRLEDMQIMDRIGISDTKSAAWALAHFGPAPIAIAGLGRTREYLAPLPVAALKLPLALVHELGRVGFKTIGQLYPVKPGELIRRFGLEPANALAGLLGHVPDPILPTVRDPVYVAQMTVPEPIGLASDLEAVLQRLANSVCIRLGKAQKGAQRFYLTISCVDTGSHVLTAGFAQPCADAATILQQFARPLDQFRMEFGADRFRLVAEDIKPVLSRQMALGESGDAAKETTRIITTLGNRLGFDRILRFFPHDSHLPERQFTVVKAAERQNEPGWKTAPRKQPLRLYNPPERLRLLDFGRPPVRFEWRRHIYRTATVQGPERLAPEWWRNGESRLRDYWTVQTAEGSRLWLLTYPGTGQPDWYVAGRFP